MRDHDAANFERRKEELRHIARDLDAKYGAGTVALELRDQYRNMEDALRGRPGLVRAALDAIRAAGLEPYLKPVRGGTDGAHLTERGLPCPNLGTGGRRAHAETEFLVVEEMEAAVQIVLRLACNPAARSARADA